MANGTPSAVQASGGTSKTSLTITPVGSERVEHKRDLASWWKNFKRSDKKSEQQATQQGIFGIPLHVSIRYANVAISLFNDEGHSYIYGYVPIVVAKCGVFLKEKATDVEGIFRLAGSEKRIKELKIAFDSPDRYGKGLDWTGYTVHDAANILRRYFNQLPEPIIPLDFYERFRQPLRNQETKAGKPGDKEAQDTLQVVDTNVIRTYQALITELPPLNRQLLLYILDLLAVFASKSDLNKMTTPNLAAIFQPGTLSHPQHDMAPQEYLLSQDVLIFLIENQDSFLIGMHGTAADADTVRDVQSGTPSCTPPAPATPTRTRTLNRSSSNASAGAESVRKWGNVRRNVSVSSKQSQGGLSPTPIVLSSPVTPTVGVQRSNTVPSRRITASPRFTTEKLSEPLTALAIKIPSVETTSPNSNTSSQATPTVASQSEASTLRAKSAASSEATTPLAAPVASETSSTSTQVPRAENTPLLKTSGITGEKALDRSATASPSTATVGGGFLNIFSKSPTSDGEGRKPNKLQKRRVPSAGLSSTHSSSHSLGNEPEQKSFVHHPTPKTIVEMSTETPASTTSLAAVPVTPQRSTTDATLRPTASPTRSYTSHTDASDVDFAGDDMPGNDNEPDTKEKKRYRWRFSRSQNKADSPSRGGASGALGMTSGREHGKSFSTIGSSQPRKSLQESHGGMSDVDNTPTNLHPYNADAVFSDSEREKKGPMSWIRGKLQERKENKGNEKQLRASDHRLEEARPAAGAETQLPQADDTPQVNPGIDNSDQLETPRPKSVEPVETPQVIAVTSAPVASTREIDSSVTSEEGLDHASETPRASPLVTVVEEKPAAS